MFSVAPIADAITAMENTPLSWNNPGALTWAPSRFCQTGKSGRFVVFCTAKDGRDAEVDKVQSIVGKGLSLNQFFGGDGSYPGYAPAGDGNNPGAYASYVASKTGLDPTLPIAEQLDGSQLQGSAADAVGNTSDTLATAWDLSAAATIPADVGAILAGSVIDPTLLLWLGGALSLLVMVMVVY